jgi:hypothetical protein
MTFWLLAYCLNQCYCIPPLKPMCTIDEVENIKSAPPYLCVLGQGQLIKMKTIHTEEC